MGGVNTKINGFWKETRCFFARKTGEDKESFRSDAAVWSRDTGKHFCGDFSYAVVRANAVIEDYSQVETCKNFTYVGIYDGHGGTQASQFVRSNLFNNLVTRVQVNGNDISQDVINNAFATIETRFVKVGIGGTVGSCCLVGIIKRQTLYVANLGDSRAVLGLMEGQNIIAVQLTEDHNVQNPKIRAELKRRHQGEERLIVHRNGAWSLRGVIQVTRSIGDAPLKQFLSAVPEIAVRDLGRDDKFVIFASDGLWHWITNEEAVELVKKHSSRSRNGIAKRLVRKALGKAIGRKTMTYRQLLQGYRRGVHDDITVIVLFIDSGLQEDASVDAVSVKAYVNQDAASAFERLAPGGGATLPRKHSF